MDEKEIEQLEGPADQKRFISPGASAKITFVRTDSDDGASPRFGIECGNVICGPLALDELTRTLYETQIHFVDQRIRAMREGHRCRCRRLLRLRRQYRRKLRGIPVQFGKAHAFAECVPYVGPGVKQGDL
jgi:hypothetical protein